MRKEYDFSGSVKNSYVGQIGNTYASDEIPHEVVSYVFEKHYSIVKAWRLYLRMNQKEAAEKIGITQGALSQIEKSETNQQGTLQKIADAWGIHVEQLDV